MNAVLPSPAEPVAPAARPAKAAIPRPREEKTPRPAADATASTSERTPATDAAAGAPPFDSQEALRALLFLRDFFFQGIERLAREQTGPPTPPPAPAPTEAPAPIKVRPYTPRSETPLVNLGRSEIEPARQGFRRLHFSCPCCRRRVVVVKGLAGKLMRCPRCFSALRAADPRHGAEAKNMEKDVLALFHPEEFRQVVGRPLPRWLMPIVERPLLILALACMVPVGLALFLGLCSVIANRNSLNQQGGVAAVAPARPANPLIDTREQAVALVQKYLSAPDTLSKAAYVRDPERVAPLMQRYFADHPLENRPLASCSVRASGLTHYTESTLTVPVTPVAVDSPLGDLNHVFMVEHRAEGPVIEWESSVGFNDRDAFESRAGGGKSMTLRVEATVDDYFNHGYADSSKWVCLRLSLADRPGETVYAYIDRKSDLCDTVGQLWTARPDRSVRRLTVQISSDAATAKTHQVRLTGLVSGSWRLPDQAALRVASIR